MRVGCASTYIALLGDGDTSPIFSLATDDEVGLSQLVLVVDIGFRKLGYGSQKNPGLDSESV